MDKYIAAITGVQMTVAGGFMALLLGGNGVLLVLGMMAMVFGTMLVGATAYDDLQSR
ncbi:hypothetical protein [Natronoarchaeum rubrum]|uniref:hypothetical protein n=1 Tax=Natronoarchaeum rubrum TaxID=755311 RepID=UPI00211333C8|nr:hypothetical protein [Natronoarchaeum rubrum]